MNAASHEKSFGVKPRILENGARIAAREQFVSASCFDAELQVGSAGDRKNTAFQFDSARFRVRVRSDGGKGCERRRDKAENPSITKT